MKISLDEFFKIIENKQEDYIVKLAYKHNWEKDYHISNEVLEYDYSDNDYIWLNDWNEGETDIYVLGYIKISDEYIDMAMEVFDQAKCAGLRGEEFEFYIDGRKFAIRELAQ